MCGEKCINLRNSVISMTEWPPRSVVNTANAVNGNVRNCRAIAFWRHIDRNKVPGAEDNNRTVVNGDS